MSELNDISLPALLRIVRCDVSHEFADKIRARIAESENPYDHGEEQYLAGLRDALALITNQTDLAQGSKDV